MLPFSIAVEATNNYYFLQMGKRPVDEILTYGFAYDDIMNDENLYFSQNPNPAEAAGQLLCWCVENGYVEVGKEK